MRKKPLRRSDDSLITPWILFCCLVIGLFVGVATIGNYVIWYTHGPFMGIDLIGDGHTLVSYSQLSNWGQCTSWDNSRVGPSVLVLELSPSTTTPAATSSLAK
uniref:Uncharacterized protein n=1 Tax=Triticum urartu TaxID=4572 RepID=A0A8R7P241_TRIUA